MRRAKAVFELILGLWTLSACPIAIAGDTPSYAWAIQAGGSSDDVGYGVALGSDGAIYIAGSFQGTATFGTNTLITFGSTDAFVAKYNSAGRCEWAKNMGGPTTDVASSITADGSGHIFLAGRFSGTASFGNYTLISSGSADIFLASYDVDGNCQWARQAGGSDHDRATAISLSAQGDVLVTGFCGRSTDFGSQQFSAPYNINPFVAKYSKSGDWLWANVGSGSGDNILDQGFGVSSDSAGNVYVTGTFIGSAGFNPVTIESATTPQGDCFLAKFGTDGECLWMARCGGDFGGIGYAVAVDDSDNIYVSGTSDTTDIHFSTAGLNQLSLSKFDSEGNRYWTKTFKSGLGISIATKGQAVIFAGRCNVGSDFGDGIVATNSGLFVAKLDLDGNCLWLSQTAQSSSSDFPKSLAVDEFGDLFLTGSFSAPIDFGKTALAPGGGSDIFLSKLSTNISSPFQTIMKIPRLGENNSFRVDFDPPVSSPVSIQSSIDLITWTNSVTVSNVSVLSTVELPFGMETNRFFRVVPIQ